MESGQVNPYPISSRTKAGSGEPAFSFRQSHLNSISYIEPEARGPHEHSGRPDQECVWDGEPTPA